MSSAALNSVRTLLAVLSWVVSGAIAAASLVASVHLMRQKRRLIIGVLLVVAPAAAIVALLAVGLK